MLLVGFYFGEMEVNKQQIIDKAIDDLGGEYPFPVRAYLHKAGCNYFTCDLQFTGVIDSHYVCSFYEFQDRQAERSAVGVDVVKQAMEELNLGNTPINQPHLVDAVASKIEEIKSRKTEHWYDYENQKALRFPPVGTVCLVNEYDKVEIVGETKDGYKVFKYADTGFFGMACQLTSYKPIDWDGGLKSIINDYLDIEDYQINRLVQAIIAAGYRKCDNKTSTTQE